MNYIYFIIFLVSFIKSDQNYCRTSDLLNLEPTLSTRNYYSIGDTITENDQMFQYEVCHGSGDYDKFTPFKLADFHGNIILISMNATW